MYVTTKDIYIYNIHVHCISLYDVIQIIPTPQALSKAEEAWSNIEAREELVNHLKDGGKGSPKEGFIIGLYRELQGIHWYLWGHNEFNQQNIMALRVCYDQES